MHHDKKLLSIIVPVFNEEETIDETVRRLLLLIDKVSADLIVSVCRQVAPS